MYLCMYVCIVVFVCMSAYLKICVCIYIHIHIHIMCIKTSRTDYIVTEYGIE